MSTENPWKRIESRTVYTNPWLTLREDRVIRPDGKSGIYTVVETRIATGVVALTPDEEIYLIGQYRYPTEEYSWEIVEGGSDPGEDPLDTAKRELREEAGLVAAQWAAPGGAMGSAGRRNPSEQLHLLRSGTALHRPRSDRGRARTRRHGSPPNKKDAFH